MIGDKRDLSEDLKRFSEMLESKFAISGMAEFTSKVVPHAIHRALQAEAEVEKLKAANIILVKENIAPLLRKIEELKSTGLGAQKSGEDADKHLERVKSLGESLRTG